MTGPAMDERCHGESGARPRTPGAHAPNIPKNHSLSRMFIVRDPVGPRNSARKCFVGTKALFLSVLTVAGSVAAAAWVHSDVVLWLVEIFWVEADFIRGSTYSIIFHMFMASSRTFISWTWPGLRWEFQPQLNELIHLSPFPNVLHLRFGKGCKLQPQEIQCKNNHPWNSEDLSAEKVHHLRTSFVGRSWLWWVWHYLVLLFGIDCASSSLPRRSSRRKWTAQCHRVRMGWHGRSWQAMVDSAKKTTFKDDIVPVFVTVGKVWSYAHCSRSTEKMRPWCSKCIQMQVAFEGLVTRFCSLACLVQFLRC